MLSFQKDTARLKALETRLLRAHEKSDNEGLVSLYAQAGAIQEAAGDIDAACFYYTHAYVFALETGHADAAGLREKLASYGREALD